MSRRHPGFSQHRPSWDCLRGNYPTQNSWADPRSRDQMPRAGCGSGSQRRCLRAYRGGQGALAGGGAPQCRGQGSWGHKSKLHLGPLSLKKKKKSVHSSLFVGLLRGLHGRNSDSYSLCVPGPGRVCRKGLSCKRATDDRLFPAPVGSHGVPSTQAPFPTPPDTPFSPLSPAHS